MNGFIEVIDEEEKKWTISVNAIISVQGNVIVMPGKNNIFLYLKCQETYEEIKKKIKEAVG